MKDLLSPRQAAQSLGVSESSFKRWCDRGVIETVRTPGGHRRIKVAEVVRYARQGRHPLVAPESIGLPQAPKAAARSLEHALEALVDFVAAGDADACRSLVIDQYLSGRAAQEVCEKLVSPALHRVGELWRAGELEVYQEHQGSEILARTLYELRKLLPALSPEAPVALGATPSGDPYRLPMLMAEVVLSEAGWNATQLGSSLPLESLATAALERGPDMVWLSVTHLEDPERAHDDFRQMLQATPDHLVIAVGGCSAGAMVRDLKSLPRVVVGDRLDELVAIAQAVSQRRSEKAGGPTSDEAP